MDSEGSTSPFSSDTIVSTVTSIIVVKNQFFREDGSLEFEITSSKTLKKDFEYLMKILKPKGYFAILRKSENNIILRVGSFDYGKNDKSFRPIALLLLTIVTVAIDGYFRTPAIPGYNPVYTIILYVAGVMGIIGFHELSHKMASARHGMKTSNPYFIPGIPTVLPTFGAFISSKDPPVNRDALFDLGLSGPIAGLIVTLLVALAGGFTAVSVTAITADNYGFQSVSVDRLTEFMVLLFNNPSENTVVTLSPLSFAATLGFLITFLNLMPAWQLDGGHIAGAVLSRRQHYFATILSIFILFLLGFWVMALFVFVLSRRNPEARPLDEVSELSQSRKIAFGGVIILITAIYFFAIAGNPYFALNF